MKIKRKALNRGTAVHVGGSKVRFVWACGCTKVETIQTPAGPMHSDMVSRLVRNWRANGVVLAQCRKHPNWESKKNQVPSLNAAYPQKVFFV